jgi:5'-3' exonuclease
MDKFGQGVEFQITRLERNRELDLNGFTKQMLLEMCILSGCDYLPSLPGMGVKRAHALIQKLKSYEKVNPVFSASIEHLSILLHYFMKKKKPSVAWPSYKIRKDALCACRINSSRNGYSRQNKKFIGPSTFMRLLFG